MTGNLLKNMRARNKFFIVFSNLVHTFTEYEMERENLVIKTIQFWSVCACMEMKCRKKKEIPKNHLNLSRINRFVYIREFLNIIMNINSWQKKVHLKQGREESVGNTYFLKTFLILIFTKNTYSYRIFSSNSVSKEINTCP